MCQLSLGHYFLRTDFDPIDIWYDTQTFGDALLMLQQRYRFDGILVNLPGRNPRWRDCISDITVDAGASHVRWINGQTTVVPHDDNPRCNAAHVELRDLRPEDLFYIEPYSQFGIESVQVFPPWQYDTVNYVRHAAPDVSVHAEVFSPFTQMLELLGYEQALLAIIDEPARLQECLAALCRGTAELMIGHARAGVDAVLISSAFAGAGFISREHYRDFVLAYEQRIIADFATSCPSVPVYTHTCGAIADRLDLIAESGTWGIDTLDPPPLGNVDLAEAKRQVGERLFIKGNVDPVNTMLMGTCDTIYNDATERIRVAAPGGGFILSTACSVAPHTSSANILELVRAADQHGWYS